MAYKSLVYTISCLIYHLQNRTIGDVLNIPHIHHRADAIHPLGCRQLDALQHHLLGMEELRHRQTL